MYTVKKKEMKLSAFHELSKDKLFEVMKNLVDAYSWASWKERELAYQKYGLDAFSEEYTESRREFASRQARKLVELSLISGTDVDSIIKGLRFSHWSLFEHIELTKLSDSVVRMRAIDCSLQRNSKARWGMEFPCKTFNINLTMRVGFVKTINPRAEVKCIFCPPDPRPKNVPENVSCAWIINIPSQSTL